MVYGARLKAHGKRTKKYFIPRASLRALGKNHKSEKFKNFVVLTVNLFSNQQVYRVQYNFNPGPVSRGLFLP
jgi:hypothetical protein